MIEVAVCDEQGTVIDRAEADTPEAATYAARVLARESLLGVSGERRTARYYVEGLLVGEERLA